MLLNCLCVALGGGLGAVLRYLISLIPLPGPFPLLTLLTNFAGAVVIGVPVGFVNVVPSKELIISLPDTPYIVARGRKGGSNVAAAICNALIYQLTRK